MAELIKAAGAGSTGALQTELLGLGLQLPGASVPLALGAHNHLGGLLGFWAFPGSHGVLRARGTMPYAEMTDERLRSFWGKTRRGPQNPLSPR